MLLDHLELPSPELLGSGINDDAVEIELQAQLERKISSTSRHVKNDPGFKSICVRIIDKMVKSSQPNPIAFVKDLVGWTL